MDTIQVDFKQSTKYIQILSFVLFYSVLLLIFFADKSLFDDLMTGVLLKDLELIDLFFLSIPILFIGLGVVDFIKTVRSVIKKIPALEMNEEGVMVRFSMKSKLRLINWHEIKEIKIQNDSVCLWFYNPDKVKNISRDRSWLRLFRNYQKLFYSGKEIYMVLPNQIDMPAKDLNESLNKVLDEYRMKNGVLV